MGELVRFVEVAKSFDCFDFPYSKFQALAELADGSSLPSLRILSARWGWSKSATHRFIVTHRQAIRDALGDRTETEKPKRRTKLKTTTQQTRDTGGDASGTAINPPPTWLASKAEPLVSFPDRTDPGHVWMTETEWAQLVERCGSLECAEHLAQSLENYIGENLGANGNPVKKVQYRDHYRTLVKWYLRKVDEGRAFSRHPQGGWGFWRAA